VDGKAIAGVLSERDCVRRLVVAGRSLETTPVSDIMVRDVITTDIGNAFADCLKLMHSHRVRHLPLRAGTRRGLSRTGHRGAAGDVSELGKAALIIQRATTGNFAIMRMPGRRRQ
jgi:CBS domain-containing protein